jgi:nondiscriminating aspartyl-tRNA synthetase
LKFIQGYSQTHTHIYMIIHGDPKQNLISGGKKIRDQIIRLLRSNNIQFDHLIHEETLTSEDSSRLRGTKREEGIKSLILVGRKTGQNYQFNIPSHLNLDSQTVKQIVGEKCPFEKADTIKEKFGLIVGGVPPFGFVFGIKSFYEERILDQERSAFNCGLRTESIVLATADLKKVLPDNFTRFAK